MGLPPGCGHWPSSTLDVCLPCTSAVALGTVLWQQPGLSARAGSSEDGRGLCSCLLAVPDSGHVCLSLLVASPSLYFILSSTGTPCRSSMELQRATWPQPHLMGVWPHVHLPHPLHLTEAGLAFVCWPLSGQRSSAPSELSSQLCFWPGGHRSCMACALSAPSRD